MLQALFFKCYYAYLHADLDKTAMYYEFLRDEFRKTGKRDTYNPFQLKELKKVKQALETGRIARNEWVAQEPLSAELSNPRNAESIKQSTVVRKIHEDGLESLRGYLGSEDLCLHNLEHPCPPYGAVDMLYMGNRTAYPLEVKKDRGEHDLVGQISKYDLSCRLQLHKRHYDAVQAVTICRSYDKFSRVELKKLGVITLTYRMDNGILKLSKV